MNIQKRLNRFFLIILSSFIWVGGGLGILGQPVQGQNVDVEPGVAAGVLPLITTTVYLPIIFNNYDPNLAPPGLVISNIVDVPGDEPLACEHPYTTRLTINNLGRGIHPQTMHFSACNTDTVTPTMFASFSLGDNTSGMIMETVLNTTTNTLDVVDQRHFPECKEMIGIDTSQTCGTIAALCRTSPGRTDYDKDVVATHSNYPDTWLYQEGEDEMWLYEWTTGDLQTEPDKYIVHKAIGEWQYGQYTVVYGENDNSYGVAVKATHAGHQADSFVIVDRDTYTLDQSRGWDWACTKGHTIYNRPSYNPVTQEYGMFCGTDANTPDAGPFGSINFATETEDTTHLLLIEQGGTAMKGGPGALHPLANGGWIGLVVGAPGNVPLPDASQGPLAEPVTQIGLVKLDQAGNQVGDINWIVSTYPYYASYPQLVPLENGNYLLGYGKMPANGPAFDYQHQLRWQLYFPMEYWVQEIDEQGQTVSRAWKLDNVAWGELDDLVSLGNNRVGWATYFMDRLTGTPEDGRWTQPNCSAEQLQFNVYTSPNP